MKCLCGYERIEEDEQGKGVGDEPFRRVHPQVHVFDGYYGDLKTMFMCPKCGTIKINIYERRL